MARTLRDAEIAFLLESVPCVRAVHVLDPPTSEFDYIASVDRLGGAELAEAHYRLVSGVGRERAARVWLALNDPSSAPRALERAVRVELDASDRELAARAIEARRERLEEERGVHFRRILAETVAWCRSGAAATQRLRTPELRPGPIHDGEWDPRLNRMSSDWWQLTSAGREAREREARRCRTTFDRMQAVAELAANRARLVRDLLGDLPSADAAGGRLLLWRSTRPRDDTTPRSPTGTARCEISDQFFDAFDCPPWDTWVSWEPRVQGGEALVSWVPPEWHLRAEAACAALGRPGVEWLREPFLGVPGR